MSQKTNLNISPYYDDFDSENNFYKVLFKPGYPVQARELTTLQSILQNQVTEFGSHMFKEGSMVIPGSLFYDNEYYAVKLQSTHLNVDVNVYVDQLVGKKIEGGTSGVTAVVNNYSKVSSSNEIEDLTIYVKYLTGDSDNEIKTFIDGEILTIKESLTYGNTTIAENDSIANLVEFNATATGAAVNISEGVYFIRGTFVKVSKDTLILDPYTNKSSYRVGLTVLEDIVSAEEDSSLYDNAKGFSNYAAPGADRLKISTTLSKKPLNDFNDTNFIELLRVNDGEIKKLQNTSQYSIIKDYFAKRTFEESGNYAVDEFQLDVKESLNDRQGNGGAFLEDQKTEQGNTPSEDLLSIKVSRGRAYVKGYDIDTGGSVLLDTERPKDTRTVDTSLVPFEFGTRLRVNNVYGTPKLGTNITNNTVELHRSRNVSVGNSPGTKIGEARVYSFNLTDAKYSDATTEWDLYVFDLQTYTVLTIDSSLSQTAGDFVRGKSSGAIGYIATTGTTTVTLTQTSGTFVSGEQIIVNEDPNQSKNITSLVTYGIEDIKSVYQDSTTVDSNLKVDFTADTVLLTAPVPELSAFDEVNIATNGNITCPGRNFSNVKADSIIRFQDSGNDETFLRVTGTTNSGLTLTTATVTTVSGVCAGSFPGTAIKTTISLGVPSISKKGGLYAELDSNNVSDVLFNNSNLQISSQINLKTVDGDGELEITDTGVTGALFESFDEERYSIHYNNGSIETLGSDQFTLSSDSTSITVTGALASQTNNVTVNTTLRKTGIKNKTKDYVRSQKITIDKTNSETGISINGLTKSSFYGTRIEDREISLNYPDAISIVAIYESLDTSSPVLDSLVFPASANLNTNSILGEYILGRTSGALAKIVTRSSQSTIEIVYLNSEEFIPNELVYFKESNLSEIVTTVNLGSYQDVTDKYSLDKGQREEYYDYSRIVRKDSYVPSRQLLVIYDRYDIPSGDDGDVYTVNSYSEERYKEDIPILDNGVRCSDILDFRPRVSPITGSITNSPFSYISRKFGEAGNTNPTLLVKPLESSVLGYKYYLPRVDRIVLDQLGNLTVLKGISSENPKPAPEVKDAMNIALISLPAYVYNTNDISVNITDNRRYTMRDIGDIESRVENIETTSSLSLLENDTKTLQVKDIDGFDRFKTGFFVDDFRDFERMDLLSKNNIDLSKSVLTTVKNVDTLSPEIALNSSINTETADFDDDLSLLDPNVQKTGNLITLKYSEKEWIKQPLASRVENVNPFNMIEWTGSLTITPSTDTWVRDIFIPGSAVTRRFGNRSFSFVETIHIRSNPDQYIRSRNVRINSSNNAPLTRYYPFFDGTSGIDIVPKLVEIDMQSGTFTKGETVEGFIGNRRIFRARLCTLNHKSGSILTPSKVYDFNPYTKDALPSEYSSNSNLLNIDIASLCREAVGEYNGYISKNVVILGTTSGAQASVSNVRFITDSLGYLEGSFFFREPNDPSNVPPLRFESGTSALVLTTSPTNQKPLPGSLLISSTESSYRTSGTVRTFLRRLVNVQGFPPPPPPRPAPPRPRRRRDPIAQSFTVDETGAFLSSVDLYFGSKDLTDSLTVEIRTVELGTPTNTLVNEYSSVEISPKDINTSTDGSVATKVKFPTPIYLEPNTEYAIVLLAPTTNNYEAWIARMKEKTVSTSALPDAESVMVSKQYVGGSLFKSQNGTIWTASQFEDMKFTLYKCDFSKTPGTAYFYNPKIDINNVSFCKLNTDAVTTLPRKLKVGIDHTTDMGGVLTIGKKISDATANGTYGYIERLGSQLSTVTVALSGSGFNNSTYTGVPLTTLTGNGSGAEATIVTSSGSITSITVTTAGTGYSVGDKLSFSVSSTGGSGSGFELAVSSITGIDTLYLTNVQGENFDSSGSVDIVSFTGSTATSYASTHFTSSNVLDDLYSGNVIEVNQYNHGMHSSNNVARLSGVLPNRKSSTLTSDVSINATSISVANTNTFSTFQGITTTSGYILIDNEVLKYTNITAGSSPAGTLTVLRGAEGSIKRTHSSGSEVYPYEINGISLVGINTLHSFPTSNSILSHNTVDKYHLQIQRPSDRSSGDNQVNFTDYNSLGGSNIMATKNVQFNSITPYFDINIPSENNSVSANMRTVSGTSASGSESSFIDQGFEAISLNQENVLSSTRLIASNENEKNSSNPISNMPKNKSLTIGINMSTDDSNLSPAIDIQNSSIFIARNRINKPITDENYSSNSLIRQISEDPHSSTYVTKKIDLSQPATSLKVLLSAYRHSSSDIRVMYQLYRPDSSGVEPIFELFPGYDNLIDTNGDGFGDKIINNDSNSGRPDAKVLSNIDGHFSEYQFSIDNLKKFTSFRIKIMMNGTNEAKTPMFKDFRTIALA